jgi:hypothetical protein
MSKNEQITIIPAQPGFELLASVQGDEENNHLSAPVVAWRIDGEWAQPISTDEVINQRRRTEDNTFHALQLPDGTVHGGDLGIYPSVFKDADEWQREVAVCVGEVAKARKDAKARKKSRSAEKRERLPA